MKFFTNLRAKGLVDQIKSSKDLSSPETQAAISKLKASGPDAVDSVLAGFGEADKQATVALVDVLAALIDVKTFPRCVEAMANGTARTAAGIAWALGSSRNYPPSMLLEALSKPGIPKSPILETIKAQRNRFTARELLTAAYSQEASEKTALFRIVGDIADQSALPELLSRAEGKDPLIRLHIISILGRFNTPEVRSSLMRQVTDPNKAVRSAALGQLAKMDGPIDAAQICALLKDPEVEVQNRAVELLQRARMPDTVRHLVPILKDENEQARRAAVEVLNEVGDTASVKYLLEALKDDDWWVRSRAGDALGKIGGPRVIDAVLTLIRDKDDDIRRAAIEILNQTKDERAVDHLISATRDKDWWVCERSVDALAEIGNKRALPRLLEMLKSNNARTLAVVARAVGKLGDANSIDLLTPLLSRQEKDVRVEAMQALGHLADEARADMVRTQIRTHVAGADATVIRAAERALTELDARFSSNIREREDSISATSTHSIRAASRPDRKGDTSIRTLLTSDREAIQTVHQAAAAPASSRLDITALRPGDMIEARYKYIQPIGKGAFGTVLLIEDTVVEERLVLKFLNPNVAEDEEIMKRFVHELRYSRKITHRNVIRIYDFLFIQGNYAISMEYFPSHTLGSEIVNETPLDLARALQFGIDICTGMTVAHQVGIVHRDLKPANVLINDEGLLKVVDFGVAAAQREGDTQLTKTGYVIGSPKYMAPEQILGKKVDARADIYALGVILYEMLTGVPPYARGDHMAVMYQHVQGKAQPPREINPKLSPELAAIIVKAMALDKEKRFQSMEELGAALKSQMPH